jgi:hypothetical protein
MTIFLKLAQVLLIFKNKLYTLKLISLIQQLYIGKWSQNLSSGRISGCEAFNPRNTQCIPAAERPAALIVKPIEGFDNTST